MTFHAEDFNVQGKMKKSQAFEHVEQMNQGVESKNYPLYQQGLDGLVVEFGKDIPQLQKRTKRQVFLMDAVARFVDEVQSIELGLERKPFQTRIGIGELFMNPTMEVLDVKTGQLIAVFEKTQAYRLTNLGKTNIEYAQDRFIAGQKRCNDLQGQIKRLEAVLDEPVKILRTTYDDLLVDPWGEKFGRLRNLYTPILRLKHAEYFGTPAGQEMLKNRIKEINVTLADVRKRMDMNAATINDLRESEGQISEMQELFVTLMNDYQVPQINVFK